MVTYDTTITEHREALAKTAQFYHDSAFGIYEEDCYADHVTESEKVQYLQNGLEYSEEVANGEHLECFAVAQKFHFYLTGESVAFLPVCKELNNVA